MPGRWLVRPATQRCGSSRAGQWDADPAQAGRERTPEWTQAHQFPTAKAADAAYMLFLSTMQSSANAPIRDAHDAHPDQGKADAKGEPDHAALAQQMAEEMAWQGLAKGFGKRGAGDLAAMIIFFRKAHVAAYTRRDGIYVAEHEDKRPSAKTKTTMPHKLANKPSAAHRVWPLVTEEGRNGTFVPVQVKPIQGEAHMRFEIDPSGKAVLYVNPVFMMDKDHVRYRSFRAIQQYLWPFVTNTYLRVSNNSQDYDHLQAGTHRGSINHATINRGRSVGIQQPGICCEICLLGFW